MLLPTRLRRDTGLVFTIMKGTPVDVTNLMQKAFRSLLERAKLPQIGVLVISGTPALPCSTRRTPTEDGSRRPGSQTGPLPLSIICRGFTWLPDLDSQQD